MRYIGIILILCISLLSHAQISDSLSSVNKDTFKYDHSTFVILDSVVVKAQKRGFDVSDFIDMVKNDNSFYIAFKNLRFAGYDFYNDIVFYNKKNGIKASYKSLAHQDFNGRCRTMAIIRTDENKKFYKRNGKVKYYTAKLYEKIFFTKDSVCDEKRTDIIDYNAKPKNKIDKYILELKKLIFSPGKKVNIPFIGSKMEIFSKKMSKYYNFHIDHYMYNDTIEAYVFTAKVKPEYVKKENKTVVKYLQTYFSKKDFQVLARNYHLKYKTLLYNFDVKMDIKLNKTNNKYYPEYIKYQGDWHVLFKKRERCKFITKIYNLKI